MVAYIKHAMPGFMAILKCLLQSVVLAGYGMISRTREGVVDGLDVVEVLERALSHTYIKVSAW